MAIRWIDRKRRRSRTAGNGVSLCNNWIPTFWPSRPLHPSHRPQQCTLHGLGDNQVSLSYRDYRDGEHKTLTLDAAEFIRRFLLHVLPKGLIRVRHYGLLANRCRVQRLAQIRKLLGAPAPEPEPAGEQGQEPEPGWPCSVCRQGRMRPVREIAPRPAALGCAPYR